MPLYSELARVTDLAQAGYYRSKTRALTHVTYSYSSSNFFFLLLLLMAKSEIDDIFAAKGKSNVVGAASKSTTEMTLESSKKKKKNKKRKRTDPEAETSVAPAPEVTPSAKAPVTVVDTSTRVSRSFAPSKASRPQDVPGPAKKKTKKNEADREGEDRFKDSRGTGPRMSCDLFITVVNLTIVYRPQDRGRIFYLQRG
jgi:hypothetical protein